MRCKKSGFSFIELILILVFFFLILAALMPMVTRRHLAPPTRSTHGTYACYWETPAGGGEPVLKETLVKGRKTIKDNVTVDPVVGCQFESPRKAKYFYVQIIGGGGGGRDLDWDSEVNPETVEKYRVLGLKEMSPDSEGFFVAGDGMNPYTDSINLSTSQYIQLLQPDTLLGIPITANHVMYLHGTSEDGYSCGEKGSAGCQPGQTPDEPYCEAYMPSECIEVKNFDDKPGSWHYGSTYSYDCEVDSDEAMCKDNNECINSGVKCVVKDEEGELVEKDIPFSPQVTIADATCWGGEPGKGMSYYKPVGVGGLSSVLSGDVFAIHHENHPSYCKFDSTLDLSTSDWNTYSASGTPTWKEPYTTRSASNTRAKDGNGLWFGGRFISTISPLYVCGGRGAEIGVTLSNDKRSGVNSGYCSYVYGDPNAKSRNRCEDGKYHDRNGLIGCQFGTFGAISSLLYGDGSESEPAEMTAPGNLTHHDYLTFRIIFVNLWQHQEIPYGVGGRAGELKTMILKSVPDGIRMVPGKGGLSGIDPQKGGDTYFGSNDEGSEISEKIAYGGDVGYEVFSIDAEIGPYSSGQSLQSTGSSSGNRTTTTVDVDSRQGGTIPYSTFVKFVISYTNKDLKARMSVFGQGGNGAATATDATCGYDYHAFALHDSNKDPAVINSIPQPGQPTIHAGTFMGGCNGYAWQKFPRPSDVKDKDYDEKNDKTNGFYWGHYPGAFKIVEHAQDGQTGAIVISW